MVTFGGFDVPRFAKQGLTDKDVFWANIEKDEKMWTVNLESVGFRKPGSAETSNVEGLKSRYLILDTGVSYSMLPTRDFETVKDALAQYGVSCVQPKDSSAVSTYTCNCPNY